MATRLDMPQKTKKNKVKAEKRRTHIPNIVPASLDPQNTSVNTAPSVSYSFLSRAVPTTSSAIASSNQSEFMAIRNDIVKTVFLAAFFVAIELGLYVYFQQ